jgi:hypothetical protein
MVNFAQAESDNWLNIPVTLKTPQNVKWPGYVNHLQIASEEHSSSASPISAVRQLFAWHARRARQSGDRSEVIRDRYSSPGLAPPSSQAGHSMAQ